jgi:hypothetical protein
MEYVMHSVSFFLTVGLAVGGVTSSVDRFKYEYAIEDPSFMHLVDEAGNPVSQEVKNP